MKSDEQRVFARYISPLKVMTCYDDDDGYGASDDEIPASETVHYLNDILAAMRKEEMLEEMERGLMHWYREDDAVNAKVRAARPTVEVENGKLVGICYAALTEALTKSEEAAFIDYITGQYSDGWGEGFEQHGIKTKTNDWCNKNKEIFVRFWTCENDWQITKTIVKQ